MLTTKFCEEIEDIRSEENMLPELMLEYAKVPLYKNSEGKISSELTLKHIKDDNIRCALKLIAKISGSKLYFGSAKQNARYCPLVPLFMSAHKEFNSIDYDEWDKNDPYLKFTMGEKLYSSISPFLHFRKGLDDNILEIRKSALEYKNPRTGQMKLIAADVWPNHTVHIKFDNIYIKWKAPELVRHIKLQTWMAHVSNRNEFMLLDTINWSNIPEALDAYELKSSILEDDELTF